MQAFELAPIGFVHSPYQQKFGIPRQPSLAPDVKSTIELIPPYDHRDCTRGLEEFDYIWLQFIFHDNQQEGWAPLVRPPRLGGSKKKGVFATRSPHRPNPIGLSLVQLKEIIYGSNTSLVISGADLLNETPILDIKPYLPFVEAKPNAKTGFVDKAPEKLNVIWSELAQQQLHTLEHSEELFLIAQQSLSQDPRPAFHEDNCKEYGTMIQNINIKFRIIDKTVHILRLDIGD